MLPVDTIREPNGVTFEFDETFNACEPWEARVESPPSGVLPFRMLEIHHSSQHTIKSEATAKVMRKRLWIPAFILKE